MLTSLAFFFNRLGKFTIYAITDTHLITTAGYEERLRRLTSFVDTVNADQPNLVIHLGDSVSSPADWESVSTLWNNITSPKLFIAGNHDFSDGETQDSVATRFGYGDRVAVGGSKFNYSQVVSFANTSFLLISLDTNTDYSLEGKLDQARLDWVSGLLVNTDCSLAVIVSHAVPHTYPSPYYLEASASALSAVVDSALSQNSSLESVYNIGGHRHPAITYLDTTTFPNLKGLVCKGSIDATGSYTRINIDANKNITWTQETI